MRDLPNALPRPPGEEEALRRAWAAPKGIKVLSEINNSYIGLYYVATAVFFFIFAGILALLIRAQLALPDSDVVSPDLYNQLFTMHGTVMMFLFAVPAVEAVGVLLLPNMLGARDLPFPRLSAYAFWAYFIGGTAFLGSLFLDIAPRAGWFMYPPLSGMEFTPDISADLWLLGIGFIEISAIAGAIEIIVGVLRTRAPGMTLGRMPVFGWAMLVFGAMIVFAFPSMIVATLLLELERAFDWPFFIAERGGDSLLWQHLFWFFGHPEVYIIFLPAAGMVSMMVPTIVRHGLVGYRLVVLALSATGLISFGLWVHHMFATGLPRIAMAFFSAAGMLVAIPSGIQVFAWIATLASGRFRPSAPAFFLLGALLVFVIGGLTGVMVAIVPFDQQVHDTFFIVAHLHYVLIGGMVMPFLGAIYYWTPAVSRKTLSDRTGRIVAILFFTGVNVTFLPMHLTGLIGMPRRVYTYPEALGWGALNLLSSLGAVIIAASVLLFLVDLARNFRPTMRKTAGNVYGAGTLEWVATGINGFRSIPRVERREPLWADETLANEIEAGAWYLPNTATGHRETIVTSTVDARPQYILTLPGPGWSPVVAALFTAAFFLLLTVKATTIAAICGLVAVASILVWMWGADRGPRPAVPIGGGINLPIDIAGRHSHARLGTLVLMLVLSAIFAGLLFAYVYLWITDAAWPPAGIAPTSAGGVAGSALLLVAAAGLFLAAGRFLPRPGTGTGVLPSLGMGLSAIALLAASALDIWNLADAGVTPSGSAYGAAVFVIASGQALLALALAVVTGLLVAKALVGRINAERRLSFEVGRLLVLYAAGQGLVALVVIHLFPRIAA
ncbi:MAG: cbb3-type cytochrome c oxidase subunit I [Bauldia sp.]|nr:cbb3-type cytochrome c oxidase subunit I [Bauldia sp.]